MSQTGGAARVGLAWLRRAPRKYAVGVVLVVTAVLLYFAVQEETQGRY